MILRRDVTDDVVVHYCGVDEMHGTMVELLGAEVAVAWDAAGIVIPADVVKTHGGTHEVQFTTARNSAAAVVLYVGRYVALWTGEIWVPRRGLEFSHDTASINDSRDEFIERCARLGFDV